MVVNSHAYLKESKIALGTSELLFALKYLF